MVSYFLQYGSDEGEDGVDVGGVQHQLLGLLQQRLLGRSQAMMKLAPDEDEIAAREFKFIIGRGENEGIF